MRYKEYIVKAPFVSDTPILSDTSKDHFYSGAGNRATNLYCWPEGGIRKKIHDLRSLFCTL